jgi:hypothetical protein
MAFDRAGGDPLEGEVEVRGSALGDVRAHEVEIEQSAVRSVEADHIEVEQSALVLGRADSVQIDRSAVVALVGRDVSAGDVRTVVLLSPSVRGNIRTLLDLRTAFAMGAGFFLARAALRMVADSARRLTSLGRQR